MITLYTSTNVTTPDQRENLLTGLRVAFPDVPFQVNRVKGDISRLCVQVPDNALYLNQKIKDFQISNPFVGEVQMYVSGYLWASAMRNDQNKAKWKFRKGRE